MHWPKGIVLNSNKRFGCLSFFELYKDMTECKIGILVFNILADS